VSERERWGEEEEDLVTVNQLNYLKMEHKETRSKVCGEIEVR
jgi:hypothetical protein